MCFVVDTATSCLSIFHNLSSSSLKCEFDLKLSILAAVNHPAARPVEVSDDQ
jgi:hypothetical protein